MLVDGIAYHSENIYAVELCHENQHDLSILALLQMLYHNFHTGSPFYFHGPLEHDFWECLYKEIILGIGDI